MIELRNLTKRFGKLAVLDDVSLSIEKGKTTVIIGPSGCGKTVLIKHIIVLLRPSEGEVYFHNERIDDMHEKYLSRVRTQMGYLFQSGALFDSMTVEENVIFPLQQHSNIKDREKLNAIAKEKLAMIGLDGYQEYYPAKLSGGQRKRVALARAIALEPEVILYDEPTTGLDPIRSDIINELIIKLKKDLGVTSIVVTHDMKSACKIGDRIIMLHKGKIEADGDATAIQNSPSEVVQRFIKGEISEGDLQSMQVSFEDIKTNNKK
ncbi:MAG TPA: ABC transporter ATP-binding protein [Phycisphaerales bacterium]|nr:ABC transporter ATP-binding protein [Phycisphaerales bacterium]